MKNRDFNLQAFIASPQSFVEKIPLCKEVCEEYPSNAEMWCYLGYLYSKNGETRKSVRYLKKALSIRPRYVDALNCLGNSYMDAKDFKAAEESFKRALSVAPVNVGIIYNLGRALNSQGNRSSAEACFRQALAVSPSYVPAIIDLGQVLHETSRYAESVQCFKCALVRTPEDPYLYCQIGSVHKNTGDFDRAQESYNKALQIRPGLVDAQAGIAAVLKAQGKYGECHDLISAMSEAHRQHPLVALIYSSLCHRFNDCDNTLRWIDGIIGQPELDDWSEIQLNFSAGDICNRMKKYDEAFEYFARGNKLKQCNYQPDVTEKLFSKVIRLFSKGFLADMPVSSNLDERPVFIVGMPRSGTTLVEQILASHPDVYGAGELPYMSGIYTRFIKEFIPEYEKTNVDALNQEVLSGVSGEYLWKLAGLSPNSKRVTDKMPYNFFRLGLIQMLFPGAKIVHCSRNPVDVCLSCFFHDFQGSHDYAYDLSNLGHYYGEYTRLMQHWRDSISLPMLDVSYEMMITDTEAMSKKLVEFCGLDWDHRCLLFHENTRYVATSSKDQVNKPIYTTSINRWKHYDKHLGELKDTLCVQRD